MPRPPRPRARILIADDEESLLANLAAAARRRGYAVDTAGNGAQALAQARDTSYDLVVTDLRMPGLDGPALIGDLLEEGISTRVVVITGYATLEAAVDCLKKGALDFLIKPFEVEDFLRSVERALGRPLPRADRFCDWDAVARRFALTRRQKEVLKAFYATGKSSCEMAKDLSLSPHTVRSHLKAAYQKLAVSTRGQLMRAVQEAGS